MKQAFLLFSIISFCTISNAQKPTIKKDTLAKGVWCWDGTWAINATKCPPMPTKLKDSLGKGVWCSDGTWVKNANECPNLKANGNYNWCPDGIHTYVNNLNECPCNCDFGTFTKRTGTAIQTDYDSIGIFSGCNKLVVINNTDLFSNEKMSFAEIRFGNNCYYNGAYWEFVTSTDKLNESKKQGHFNGTYWEYETTPINDESTKSYSMDKEEIISLLKLLDILESKSYQINWKADGIHSNPMKITFQTKSGLIFYASKPTSTDNLDIYFYSIKSIARYGRISTTECGKGYHWNGKTCVPDIKNVFDVKDGKLPNSDLINVLAAVPQSELNNLIALLKKAVSKL